MSGESLWLMTERARSGSSVVAMLSVLLEVPAVIHRLELLQIEAPGGLDNAPRPVKLCRPVIDATHGDLYIYTVPTVKPPAAGRNAGETGT